MTSKTKNGKLRAYLDAVYFSCKYPNMASRSHREICKFHGIDEKAAAYALERSGLVSRLESTVGWEGWVWLASEAVCCIDIQLFEDHMFEYRTISTDPRKMAQEKNKRAEQAMEFFRQVSEDAKNLVEKLEKLAELMQERD